jgi:hypothetical protein
LARRWPRWVERLLGDDPHPSSAEPTSAGANAGDEDQLEPGWWARLHGEQLDLQALLTSVALEGLQIRRRDDQYYLHSDDFDGIDASEAVERRAEEIVRVLNGAAQIHYGTHRPVRVGGVVSVTETGAMNAFVHLSGSIMARGRLSATLSVGGAPVAPTGPTEVQQFTVAGLADEDAERALRIFGRDDVDWRDLYFIFEIVEASVGGAMYDKGWATRAEVSRFTHTANSPTALADEARHGHERAQPPADPMTFEDASELVRRLLRAWLTERAQAV